MSLGKIDPGLIAYVDDEPSIAPAKGHTRVSKGDVKIDLQGRTLYTIHLRENMVKNARKLVAELPAPRPPDAKENGIEFRGWHRNEMQFLTKALEKDYGFEAVGMTSWIGSTITAYLSDAVAQRLSLDERVYEVEQNSADVKVQHSAVWNDRYDGAELVTWGKQAIGTDDLLTSSNTVYLVDQTPWPHPDLSIVQSTFNGNSITTGDHGTFIAGIIGAQRNNSFSRGINPGATNFWSVDVGDRSPAAVMSAFDWTLLHSEYNQKYGVINFSLNGQFPSSDFRYDLLYGKLIRRASARSMVAQSAGNKAGSACDYAYCSAVLHAGYNEGLTQNSADGIVVVGGINANGAPDIDFNVGNPVFGYEAGSNYGHCVELWAPSTTTSTYTQKLDSTTFSHQLLTAGGTSFAAPHVAALAARYGDNTTTPVQREAYLRSKLQHTGYSDAEFRGVYKPSALASSLFTVPSRLMPVSISASSSTYNSDLWSTQDSLYISGNYWNAGSTTGWIMFDLGQMRSISSIRLVPEQSAGGQVNHKIWVGDDSTFSLVKTINEYAEILSPIAHSLNNTQGRYLRINSNLTNLSWVSWREVEIYGF